MKYILIVVFLLVVATLYFVFTPDQAHVAGKLEQVPQTNAREVTGALAGDSESNSEAELRHAAMQEEFAKLEKARRDLDRKLSRLKALLWDLEFPAEKSAAIKEQMQSGYALLKNKKLLGAYRNLDQLKEERGQIDFIHQALQQIEQEVREIRDSKRNQPG